MKIAVTGATGFIGRHVVAEMERRSMSPVLMGQPSVEIPLPLARHVVVSMDLREPPANAFDLLGRPDALIHLAWAGLPNYKSLHHFEEELPASVSIPETADRIWVKNSVITGTCFEYGMQSGLLSEDLETQPVILMALPKTCSDASSNIFSRFNRSI